MRYSLACDLADCIETDGHIVCIWGQGQNLLGALHGHYFALRGEQEALLTTPAELLTLVGSKFSQSLAADGVEDPMPHEVEKFCRDAMLRAGQVLTAADAAPFRRRLIEYVEVSGWAVPTF